jgi:hypothetical protein
VKEPGFDRRRKAGARAAFCAGLVCASLAVLSLASCDRTPRLVPASNDTTAVVPDDAYDVMLRDAGRRWESGEFAEAADLTARALRVDLRTRGSGEWARRATSLLDSMNVGAEVVGDDCAIVVNLFSRSNPTGTSWPYVFWCDADTLRQQGIDGEGLRLLKFASREVKGEPVERGLAVLFGRGERSGVMPTLMVFEAAGNGWKLAQTLGPDSLGGVGSGEFRRAGDAIELTTTTFRIARGFVECASCPHVLTERRFRWEASAFTQIAEETKETPYATFVRFIQSLRSSDYVSAMACVTDRVVVETAVYLGWGRAGEPWRVAPGTHDRAREMVFFHGQGDAFRVWFEPRGDGWAIASVDTTARTVDIE